MVIGKVMASVLIVLYYPESHISIDINIFPEYWCCSSWKAWFVPKIRILFLSEQLFVRWIPKAGQKRGIVKVELAPIFWAGSYGSLQASIYFPEIGFGRYICIPATKRMKPMQSTHRPRHKKSTISLIKVPPKIVRKYTLTIVVDSYGSEPHRRQRRIRSLVELCHYTWMPVYMYEAGTSGKP